MRRINTTTKGKITDANGKSFDGFIEGDPREGVEPTHLSDSWCNNLQEEICNVIEGVGGHTVSGSDVQVEKYDQMFQAIKLLVDTATPIGSVKAMPIKMSDSYMARWVPIDEDDAGRLFDTGRVAYLSKEMAKNCEKVEGNTEGWYKLVTGNKENGEASGAFGWALADGTFPLPISSFGEDVGQRPTKEKTDTIGSETVKGKLISDTEYGKIWLKIFEDTYVPRIWIDTDFLHEIRAVSSNHGTKQSYEPSSYPDRNVFDWPSDGGKSYFLEDEDLLPPENDTPIDLRIWRENNTKRPKLIPNLNDKTFLMGSNEEDLSMRVEGKNGFIMKPYHMPPHVHVTRGHVHSAWCTKGGNHKHEIFCMDTTNVDFDKPISHGVHTGFGNSDGVFFTNESGSHRHDITIAPTSHEYTKPTGGFYGVIPLDNESDPVTTNLYRYGAVPIDLRPKRMTVHYYIRVI